MEVAQPAPLPGLYPNGTPVKKGGIEVPADTPSEHAGERAMCVCSHHNEQSLRVADIYGRNGRGLNLTSQVREAILVSYGIFCLRL